MLGVPGNSIFAERNQVCAAWKPVDFNAAAQTGDWVSLKNFQRCTCVVYGKAGSAGTDMTVTLEQATSVAGAGVKNLATITRVDKKEGADLFALGQYTTDTQAAAATYTTTNNEQSDQIYLIDVLAEDLDIANDFDCMRMSINAGNASKITAGLYILQGPKFVSDPLPSAIID
jgi:hypothetical protein